MWLKKTMDGKDKNFLLHLFYKKAIYLYIHITIEHIFNHIKRNFVGRDKVNFSWMTESVPGGVFKRVVYHEFSYGLRL